LALARPLNKAGLAGYIRALRARQRPPSEIELLDEETRSRERLLLGLRLDEPLELSSVKGVLDEDAAERLWAGGLVELGTDESGRTLSLTSRGRFLGGGVTGELMVFAAT